jgi:hypothetical protein
MSTTTGDAVATLIATRITAIVPGLDSDDRFEEITYEQGLASFALADPGGCLRRFSVMPGPTIEGPDVTDGRTEAVTQDMIVEVAYPTDWRHGPRALRDLVAAIDADRSQIAKTVGTNGFAAYASDTGEPTVWTAESGETRDDLGPVQIGVVRLRARYFRSATP